MRMFIQTIKNWVEDYKKNLKVEWGNQINPPDLSWPGLDDTEKKLYLENDIRHRSVEIMKIKSEIQTKEEELSKIKAEGEEKIRDNLMIIELHLNQIKNLQKNKTG